MINSAAISWRNSGRSGHGSTHPKTKTKTVHTLKYQVNVLQRDIDSGECRIAARCMEKVANVRALQKHLQLSDDELHRLHVRVDAGHIKFNYDDHHWEASTPKIAKTSLIKFDRNHLVHPHSYSVVATRKEKIIRMTAERQNQINIARAARIEAGQPDRPYGDLTIRKRIVGYDLGRSRAHGAD